MAKSYTITSEKVKKKTKTVKFKFDFELTIPIESYNSDVKNLEDIKKHMENEYNSLDEYMRFTWLEVGDAVDLNNIKITISEGE